MGRGGLLGEAGIAGKMGGGGRGAKGGRRIRRPCLAGFREMKALICERTRRGISKGGRAEQRCLAAL